MSDVDSSSMLLGKELVEFCESESSLSEEGLHEIIDRYGWTPDNTHHINDYKFFLAACENERVNEAIIRCLLEYFPAAASAAGDYGEGPLHYACKNKSATIGKIQVLIDAAPNSVRSKDNDGYMPLHALCNNREVDETAAMQILKFLIGKCPDAVRHAADEMCGLPIHFAAGRKSPEFCRVLIEAYPGCEQIPDADGVLPLHIASKHDKIATVEYLYQQYPEAIHHATTDGLYPIHYAIKGSKVRDNPAAAVEIVRFLLSCDSNENLEKHKGRRSLLHYASGRRYSDSNVEAGIQIITTLLDAHPDSIRNKDDKGRMPLHSLCRSFKKDAAATIPILKFLIEKCPEAIRHADSNGDLPIHFAAETKSPDFCQVLIETYPGSEQIPNANGQLPFHVACGDNTVATVEYLYQRYPDALNHATAGGLYPIHYAIDTDDRDNPAAAVDIVRFLLDCDPNQKLKEFHGQSLLHYACGRHYDDSSSEAGIEMIKTIYDAHPDSVRSEDNNGWMPLHALSASARKVNETAAMQILKLLIEKCPEAVRHAENDGDLPIHLAARTKSPEFCQVLIEAYLGSEQIPDNVGALPFHFACARNSLAAVEYLYEQYPGAINHATTDGLHPIHCAIVSVIPAAAVDIVQFLLNCDPNEKLKKCHGQSLLRFACGRHYDDSSTESGIQIIKILLDANPESIRGEDDNGWMPLHAFSSSASKMNEAAATEMLKLLIEKNPEALRHAGRNGDLPIHLASWGKSPDFLRVLIKAYPGSEQIPSSADGALPLHLACQYNTLAAVEYLYEQYPDANNATPAGLYPIHYAIEDMRDRHNPADAVEIVHFLLDCDPRVTQEQRHGESLLYSALEREYNDSNIEAGIEIIKALYDAHPEAIEDNAILADIENFHHQVQEFINGEIDHASQAEDLRLMNTPDDNGQLPLHRALQNNVRLGSIKLLVKGNPSAIRTSDINFAMPLHIACESHDSAKVIEYLLNLDRRTLRAVDIDNNTALHYACRGLNHDIIALLLEKYDATSVSKRNAQGKLPIDLLWESGEVSDRESGEYMGSVWQLLRAYPEMLAISSNSMEGATRNGKKRKRNEEV